jgi:hypothetical protein
MRHERIYKEGKDFRDKNGAFIDRNMLTPSGFIFSTRPTQKMIRGKEGIIAYTIDVNGITLYKSREYFK